MGVEKLILGSLEFDRDRVPGMVLHIKKRLRQERRWDYSMQYELYKTDFTKED